MAREVRAFQVVVPAGTPASAAWSQDVSFPPREVVQVEVKVPPGPRGEVGFALGSGGISVLPANDGGWIVADDQDIVWPLDGQWNSGAWSVQAYNTGQYDHTLYVTFLLDLPNATTAGAQPSTVTGGSSAGVPAGTGSSGTGTAPGAPPPPSLPPPPAPGGGGTGGTAPSAAPPLILPPSLPPLPGQSAPPPTDAPQGLLLGLADQGAAVYLSGPVAFPVADQASLEGIQGASVPAASISDAEGQIIAGTSS